MSTPNTHEEGVPERLRMFAGALARLHWQETTLDLSGLLAAAARIEKLEVKVHDLRVENERLKAAIYAARKGAK